MSPQLPPKTIISPAAWLGIEMTDNPDKWLFTLSESDIADLESATTHFLSLNRDISDLSKQDFPLAHFGKHLEQLKQKLIKGLGIEVLRGLPTANYSQAFIEILFCGIGAHLGSARSQNAAGDVLGHVRDTGAKSSDPNARIYQTAERQTFHTDSADVVGLICINEAKQGGKSMLVSAESIYNQMMSLRPDLTALLFDPIATDRRGEIPEGGKPYMEIPPLSWHQDRLTVFYQRQYIDSAQRFDGAMKLTPAHTESLDLFDSLANDPELNFGMQLAPGDMQFVYNHAQLHDRTSFLDWPEPSKRRHLLRLWLSIEGDRELPTCFKERYGSIDVGNRGGIITPDKKKKLSNRI